MDDIIPDVVTTSNGFVTTFGPRLSPHNPLIIRKTANLPTCDNLFHKNTEIEQESGTTHPWQRSAPYVGIGCHRLAGSRTLWAPVCAI